NTSILNAVPFFAKYGLTSLIEYIIPYAAALDVEIIDKYRRENTDKLSADHPFYFAVYEAKAH
uniref:SAM-dependent methyltransferase n=1 Tax=Romanomermis culicivorax TaxID=13658 RepID=A0A915I539_ROMCU